MASGAWWLVHRPTHDIVQISGGEFHKVYSKYVLLDMHFHNEYLGYDTEIFGARESLKLVNYELH